MILKNNAARPISFGTGLPDASVKIIKPGTNDISKEDWAVLEKHPVIKAMLKSKEFEIVGGEKGGETEGKELKDLSSKDATKLVGETFDTAVLKSWLESETRSPIKKAIETQLEKIESERAGQDGSGNE